MRETGPEGSGATGATGCVGTGGDGGGPTRPGGGVRGIGWNDSTLPGVVAPSGSGDGDREDFEEWCRLPEKYELLTILGTLSRHRSRDN